MTRAGAAAVAWGAAAGYMALIFALSSRTIAVPPEVLFPHADKLVHVGEYGVLSVLLSVALASSSPGASARGIASAAALLASLYGASDEWHQSFVPGRVATVGDWIADTVGAALAAAAVALWRGRRGTSADSGTSTSTSTGT
ncbi:MAG: VanZ family protein [Planctomycetales bacterium]|nr:VanZ family protein [Planctomycetales bacterium]